MTTELDFSPPPRLLELLRGLAALGGITLLVGLFLAPERAWPNLLLASCFLLGLGLGGAFFVALQYVTGSSWSVALRRVPEAMTALLPAGAVGLAVVLVGNPSLYPWLRISWTGAEGFVAFKQAWLSQPFFLARAAIYVLVWMAFSALLLRNSRLQDADGSALWTRRNARLSAIFIVVFALTSWLASYDWIMSLEPSWYSTIFAVYNFASLFLGTLAAMAVLVVLLRRARAFGRVVSEQHLIDLARLIFAFGTFWAYIWFSQYMLIWYANMPEETSYFIARLSRGWAPLFLLNLGLNWVVPFLVLMPRGWKRNPDVLLGVAIAVVAGRWLDLYLMIFPPLIGAKPAFGVWELGAIVASVGVSGLVILRALRQAPLVPVRDPLLAESLHYHG